MAKYSIDNLIDECRALDLHCSLSYQDNTQINIEIYRGYQMRKYVLIYSQGHNKTPKKAIKKAFKFLKNDYKKGK